MTDIKAVEAVARAISPSFWMAMDAYKEEALRKHKGDDSAFNHKRFQHAESMAVARKVFSTLQSLGWRSPAEVQEIADAARADATKL